MAHALKHFGPATFRIDRPKGFVKTWDLPNGGIKRYVYPVSYGYFPKLVGQDGEGLDAFVGDTSDGHFESFVKLKPEGSRFVIDETKFLVGVTDAERAAIYKLYSFPEVSDRVVYRDLDALLAHAQTFPGKKRFSKEATAQNPVQQVGESKPVEEEHAAKRQFDVEAGKIAALRKFGLADNSNGGDPGYSTQVKREPEERDTRTGIDIAFNGNQTFDQSSSMTMPGTINNVD